MAGQNGGRRRGAGRPPGSKRSAKALEMTAQLAQQFKLGEKVTPLEVMAEAMNHYYAVYRNAATDPNTGLKALDKACEFASMSAPYIHPKLASTELKGDPNKPLIKPDVKVILVSAENGIKP